LSLVTDQLFLAVHYAHAATYFQDVLAYR